MLNRLLESVIDANIALNFAAPTLPFHAQARRLFTQMAEDSIQLLAPAFYVLEVDSAVRTAVLRGQITPEAGCGLHLILDALPIAPLADPALRPLARELTDQIGQPNVHDSTYLALAQIRGCEFWTADKRLRTYARTEPGAEATRLDLRELRAGRVASAPGSVRA